MGIFSWLRPRKSSGEPEQEQERSLIRARYDDPKLAEARREAAEDIAEMEQSDRHPDRDA